MWTSLRGRFVLLMLLGMGGITAAAILTISEIERDEALQAVEREEASLADTVRQVVSGTLERETTDRRRLRRLIAELTGIDTVQSIEVFDDEGRIILHSDRSLLGQKPHGLHRDFVDQILAGNDPITQEDAEQQRFNLFVSVTNEDSARVLGVISVVLSWEAGQPVPDELGRTVAAAAQAELAQAFTNAHLERGRLQRLTESLAEKDTLKQVEVFSPSARVIAHSQPEQIGEAALPQHSSVIRQVFQSGVPVRQVSDDGEEISRFVPIVSQSDSSMIRRVARVTITPTPILTQLVRSRSRYIWCVVVAGLIAGAVLWASSNHFMFRPLTRVARAARDVAEGRVGTTVSVESSGEIKELINAFNHMSRSLESTTVSRDELASSEERLQLALEATRTSCWDIELDSDFVVSTRTIEPLLGYEASEVPASREWWQSLVHPDDVAVKERALRNYLDGSASVYECEYRVRSESGEWRWNLDRGHAVTRRDDGRPLRMVGTDTDITRLKRDEQLLLGNNRVLEAIARGEPLAEVFSLLVEFVEAAAPGANATALRLDAYTGQLHGIGQNRMPESYNQAIDGVEIGPGVGSCGAAAFTGQRVIVADVMTHENWAPYRQLAVDAGFRACWSEPILDRTGNVLGTFAIYHDTPQEPGEESLRVIETAAKLSAIAIESDNATRDLQIRDRALAASGNGIVIVDVQHAEQPIVYCNRAFERITGYGSTEVIGQNCRILQSGDANQPGLQEIREAIHERRNCRVILQNFRKNGELFWNELTVSPVVGNGGEVTHFVGVQNDITEQRNAEEQARQQMEQLAHVGRLTTVGELATGIAHELNQPLTAIVNTAFICEQNLSQDELPPAENLRQSVATISEQAFRASEIIRRLRSLVKRTPVSVSNFDVNGAINEVVSLIKPIARQNGITVQLSLEDSLPSICADEIQFQQVMLNLLKNACDALQQKTAVDRQVTVESHLTDSNDVMISVSDDGPGLPDGEASRAFDAFFTTKDEGMGMGLAISRSIVETHRGRLWAENNSQGGATFRLTLPVTTERRRRA